MKSAERILRDAQPQPFAGSHLFFGSDYGGSHKESLYHTYCYFIVDTDNSPHWPAALAAVRSKYLPDGRRMSFKKLNDRRKMAALVPYLETTNEITGHLVSFIVPKSYSQMVVDGGDLKRWFDVFELAGIWNHRSLESVVRASHIFAMLVALWARPKTDITWITDEDEIVANETRLDDAQKIAARLSAVFGAPEMGVFAMNTTGESEFGGRFEDAVAFADLAAGMLSEISSKLTERNSFDERTLAVPLSEKSEVLSDWFWRPYNTFQRTCILYTQEPDSRLIRGQRLTMLRPLGGL